MTIDVGIITGSGLYDLPGASENLLVETRFGVVEVAVMEIGGWRVGGISRHGAGHRNLPHTVAHRANLKALEEIGTRAVLATTAVGAVGAVVGSVALGQPLVFDDLYFPENRMPDGGPCTFFTEPGDAARGHLIQSEPFAPRLRNKLMLAAESLGLEATAGGVYGHVNGPRFNTAAEIKPLREAGVSAVSQTCGPETVLAGELELPYALVGFPVNYTPGAVDSPEPEGEMDRLFGLSKKVLPRLLLRTVETLIEKDFIFDHGYVYRVEGGV